MMAHGNARLGCSPNPSPNSGVLAYAFRMTVAPTVDRARRQLQATAEMAASADPANAAQTLLEALLSALPHASGGTLLLMHPQTGLFWTGAVDGLPAESCHPYFYAELSEEPDSFRRLAATNSPARARLREGTDSAIGEVVHRFGFRDEIRVVCSDGGVVWGGVTLWSRDAEFSRADERLLDSVAPTIGRALRDSVLAALDARSTQPGGRGLIVFEGNEVVEAAGIGRELVDAGSNQYGDAFQGPPLAHLQVLAAADPRFSTVMRFDDGSWISANGTDMGNDRVGVLLAAVTSAELLGAKVAAAGLTGREVEVTRLLCRGLTDAEIAVELFLSPHTVHDHVRSIRRKLGVRSRAGVASRVFTDAYFDAFLAGAAVAHTDG